MENSLKIDQGYTWSLLSPADRCVKGGSGNLWNDRSPQPDSTAPNVGECHSRLAHES